MLITADSVSMHAAKQIQRNQSQGCVVAICHLLCTHIPVFMYSLDDLKQVSALAGYTDSARSTAACPTVSYAVVRSCELFVAAKVNAAHFDHFAEHSQQVP